MPSPRRYSATGAPSLTSKSLALITVAWSSAFAAVDHPAGTAPELIDDGFIADLTDRARPKPRTADDLDGNHDSTFDLDGLTFLDIY